MREITNKENHIITVYCDDWEGVYINGEIEYESHSVGSFAWTTIISKYQHFNSDIKSFEVDFDYMSDRGNLPHYFKELEEAGVICE